MFQNLFSSTLNYSSITSATSVHWCYKQYPNTKWHEQREKKKLQETWKEIKPLKAKQPHRSLLNDITNEKHSDQPQEKWKKKNKPTKPPNDE